MIEISVTVNGQVAEAQTLRWGNTREITFSSRSLTANLPPHSTVLWKRKENRKRIFPAGDVLKDTGFHPGNVAVLQLKEMLQPCLIFLLSLKWSLFSLEDGRKGGRENK